MPNQEQINGLARNIAQALCGAMVLHGITAPSWTELLLESIIGSLIIAALAKWSHASNSAPALLDAAVKHSDGTVVTSITPTGDTMILVKAAVKP
jgi:hypothetical protein